MTVYILGVSGRLMAGVACLASEKGFEVIGYDRSFDPPMSTVLESENIQLVTGYPDSIAIKEGDIVIVGNHLRRTAPLIQWLIQKRIKLYSAPEWLMDFVLRDRQVIAVTGSHGKTTITTMIAWILEKSGYYPGYLIGGVSSQLQKCASLGKGPYFVIEADEYDTAFFDKRPKFVHYWPSMLVISHIEYDHADIYPDVDSIIKQYSYLLRLLPNNGYVAFTNISKKLVDVIHMFKLNHDEYGSKKGMQSVSLIEDIDVKMIGAFNRENALAAYLIARKVGIKHNDIKAALASCTGPERRQKLMYQGGVSAYDDFAHHPSALLQLINAFQPKKELIIVYHPSTYTQREGTMDNQVIAILKQVKLGILLLPKKHQLHVEAYQKAGIVLCEDEVSCFKEIQLHVATGNCIVVASACYLSDLWEKTIEHLKKEH